MQAVTVSPKFQVVIPKKVREQFRLMKILPCIQPNLGRKMVWLWPTA